MCKGRYSSHGPDLTSHWVGGVVLAALLGSVVFAGAVLGGFPFFGQGQETYTRTDSGSYTSTSSAWSSTSSENSTVSSQTVTSQSPTESTQTSSTSSPSLSMTVNATILDQAQACAGSANCTSVIYILNMTVRNTGGQDCGFNELNLHLQTEAGNSYPTYPIVYAIQDPADGRSHAMPSPVSLAPGQSAAGEEGFDIPANETPETLVYQDWNINASATIPQPSSWVSEVVTTGEASISPNYLSCSDPGNSQVQSCYTASFEGMNNSILGSADYFTGEVMAFQVSISLGKGPSPGPEPGTVTVESTITEFAVENVSAPQCVGSDPTGCTSWEVDVYLVIQPGLSYYGSPSLTVILPPA